jgi:hypothetical protein
MVPFGPTCGICAEPLPVAGGLVAKGLLLLLGGVVGEPLPVNGGLTPKGPVLALGGFVCSDPGGVVWSAPEGPGST